MNTVTGNGADGVFVSGATQMTVSMNTLTGNGGDGVAIAAGTGITISRNSIADNAGLGIDLGSDGVTANDARDRDSGPNDLQNFPVLFVARDDGTATSVRGRIDTENPELVTIELFTNDAPDRSGFGEGQTFLATVMPDASGRFQGSLPTGLAGKFLTATATNADGSTSEFSEAVIVRDWMTDFVPLAAERHEGT
jgi:parallel beta-helix repeat protein